MRINDIKKNLNFLLKTEVRAVKDLFGIMDDKRFWKAIKILKGVRGKIVVTGSGKSGHVGRKIVSTMVSIGIPTVFLDPSEAMHGDLGIVSKDDALIAISNSGQTAEILKIIKHLVRHKIPIIGLTGKSNSKLAKISNEFILFNIKKEGSPFNLAPMASTTATLVIGDLIATSLSLIKGFTKNDFADFHPGGSLGLQLTKVEELMISKNKIPKVKDHHSFKKAIREINSKQIGVTAVTNKRDKLVGVITDGDIRRTFISSKFDQDAVCEDVMTKDPKTIKNNQSLREAIGLMENFKITALFVVDNRSRLIGVIHLHQILEQQFGMS